VRNSSSECHRGCGISAPRKQFEILCRSRTSQARPELFIRRALACSTSDSG
jgi:hypothetical protein